MNCGMSKLIARKTHAIFWLKVVWEMPDLFQISPWNVPVAKNPRAEKDLIMHKDADADAVSSIAAEI